MSRARAIRALAGAGLYVALLASGCADLIGADRPEVHPCWDTLEGNEGPGDCGGNDNECRRCARGEACFVDADCATSACVQGACAGCGPNLDQKCLLEACTSSGECGEGLCAVAGYCAEPFCNTFKQCGSGCPASQLCPASATCKFDEDCASGVCEPCGTDVACCAG